jgi:sterol 24-C-methyltransferase
MPSIKNPIPKGVEKNDVASMMHEYRGFHNEAESGTIVSRAKNYKTMINHYYDLVTDFYEYGWGQSFHFAPREKGESFKNSLIRHEHYLADQMELRSGAEVIDLGCGVAGPLREIARHAGVRITGVNNNVYQIAKCNKYIEDAALNRRCSTLKADFMHLPLANGSFDAAYTIEASCHAPDRLALFKEVYRILKPGGQFAGYEWCLTDLYDEKNPDHRQIKKGIEEGDALPDILHTREIVRVLKEAGFDVLDSEDRALTSDPRKPWYLPIEGKDLSSLHGLLCTRLGRRITHFFLAILEKMGIAPKGSMALSALLIKTADYLVEAGKKGIFTPMFFFRARKP